MSAPAPDHNKPSMDGTTINFNNSAKGHNEPLPMAEETNELDRYVTDDLPRQPRMAAKPQVPDAIMAVQPLRKNEMQPSYAQDLGTGAIDHGCYGSMMNVLGECIGALGMIPCCPCPNPFNNVSQGSVGLVSRFGQFYKSVDPGLVKVNVCTENVRVVDVKIQLTSVPRQTVQTKDNVSVEVDSVICWHVISPYRAAFGINDVRSALVERAQTTLRQVVGGRVLQSVISDREGLAHEVAEIIEATAEKWGVAIESILLKDINFSVELQQSLSSAATQKRIGESKVIAARAEVDAAKLMRQAADILASPAAMQIRQLEALQNMARSSGSKVVFVPMNLGTMGAAGMQDVAHQIAASGHDERADAGPSTATNAGLISSMANV
ncbi:stomatin family protein [Cryptococcus neoformans]|uniref:Stomatin family protein n=2 Tax=Cryptococcus neoformans TaxID=5207 RepID=A0A854QF23_CRYNE|nr:stomatin family protein [Cryptococcus neoformans var. grubii H99]AUB24145.1 stomatin family protein [Cryptococcus neoformans var. grubii]OWZ32841.1 stomatin family protein [Cryptococcus neoformans var. grubii AD2-60a]OWZ45135.1 stomatin family protein [Cryptococcus neoformans var. grubii C23]OXC85377.1 stomatin family protein [Cryptococcus neoformans var. grubii AD1-7a]OXG23041.1 stomatin family protein [Cryptococcus neoformans var. grubii Tu259-1]OXG28662.1 stomatin family protein [Crypto|eukprot:XP_012048547.1 stomatin family protein [Cryptococcus neoformans var. grubii H99]